MQKPGRLSIEAEDIYRKARRIRVPQLGTTRTVVEFIIHPITKSFDHFQLVPETRPEHKGASPTVRLNVVDMHFVREMKQFDKSGYWQLIDDIKKLILGDAKVRMTKAKCEIFFEDEANFVLGEPNTTVDQAA